MVLKSAAWLRRIASGGRIQAKFLDRTAANQVLLNDAFKHFGAARMIPDPVGPYHGNRPGTADLEAIGLGALHASGALGVIRLTLGPDQAELLEPAHEVTPRRLALLARAAFLLLRESAQENLALDPIFIPPVLPDKCGLCGQKWLIGHSSASPSGHRLWLRRS